MSEFVPTLQQLRLWRLIDRGARSRRGVPSCSALARALRSHVPSVVRIMRILEAARVIAVDPVVPGRGGNTYARRVRVLVPPPAKIEIKR